MAILGLCFEFLKMKGIKIAICSSLERKFVEESLKILNIGVNDTVIDKVNIKISNKCERLNRRESFKIDYLICGNDMIPCKPLPDSLLQICNKMKVNPSQSMIVGDMISDIHAGINAQFSRIVSVLSENFVCY